MPELTWYGKYDANGKRNGPLRVTLPFQTVETVNESAQERQRRQPRSLDGCQRRGRPSGPERLTV